jgi:hypothetical protein
VSLKNTPIAKPHFDQQPTAEQYSTVVGSIIANAIFKGDCITKRLFNLKTFTVTRLWS